MSSIHRIQLKLSCEYQLNKLPDKKLVLHKSQSYSGPPSPGNRLSLSERLRNENEDKTKTHDWIDLGYFGAKSWYRFQNIDWMITLFAFSSCLCSHFIISLLLEMDGKDSHYMYCAKTQCRIFVGNNEWKNPKIIWNLKKVLFTLFSYNWIAHWVSILHLSDIYFWILMQ